MFLAMSWLVLFVKIFLFYVSNCAIFWLDIDCLLVMFKWIKLFYLLFYMYCQSLFIRVSYFMSVIRERIFWNARRYLLRYDLLPSSTYPNHVICKLLWLWGEKNHWLENRTEISSWEYLVMYCMLLCFERTGG